jgi:hypothetical protein
VERGEESQLRVRIKDLKTREERLVAIGDVVAQL